MEKLIYEFRKRGEEVSPAVKEKIVLEYLPLVRYIVKRLGRRLPSHLDLDDLYNTGVIGLLDAIDKYDQSKNASLKTYAEFRIKGAILDQLRSLDWIPRSVRGKKRKIERAYQQVEQRLGRPARYEEVADALGISVDVFHELMNQALGTSLISLEGMRGRSKENEEVGDFTEIIQDLRAVNPFNFLAHREAKKAVKAAIASLPDAEKAVISFYFYSGLSEDAIGRVLGVTESRIAQLITRACERLEKRVELEQLLD